MRYGIVLAFVLVGCAADSASTRPSEGPTSCPLGQFNWEASDHDYDKLLDQQVVDKIAAMIQSERDLYHATPAGQVPAFQAVAAFKDPPKHFVAMETFQFAVRLRQLECAAISGPLAANRPAIEDRFNKLLEEIKARRAALEKELPNRKNG